MQEKYGEDIYDQLAQRRTYRYMDRYRGEIEDIRLHLPAKLVLKCNRECNNAVFTMWLQGYGNMPAIVQACVESMERLNKKIVFLTEENLPDYVYLPEYIWEKYKNGKIGKIHFSDIVRVAVLATYGGVWIDSTVYIAEAVPEYMTDSFFVFKQSPQLRECRQYANWWIAAPAGDKIILDQLSYLLCYWKYENVVLHYYFFHIFFRKIVDNNVEYKRLLDRIPTRITDQTHELLKNYNQKYDAQKWEWMKRLSPVFKCSYKVKGLASYDTFYCKLCNGELE